MTLSATNVAASNEHTSGPKSRVRNGPVILVPAALIIVAVAALFLFRFG